MSLASDYFLLYHGMVRPDKAPLAISEDLDDETFTQVSALLLSTDRKSIDTWSALESFHLLASKIYAYPIQTSEQLYDLQESIIRHFTQHRDQETITALHDTFTYLQQQSIITRQNLDKLISLFDPKIIWQKEESPTFQANSEDDFHTNKKALILAIEEIKEICEQTKNLDPIIDYLQEQKFSIGITGVMNAGKSTLLNALLGKELLGTSVVPETANLTIITYAKEPIAKVVYWNQAEWQMIEKSAQELKAMEHFVKETKKAFKKDLGSFILDQSRQDHITIKELAHYTSAQSSNKRCNLVKYVELGADLHFLQEGIEIVDTPGLDDIVIQREEITKEYVSRCDLMIHLMNVNQSATKKDIEFILDALLFQNITKLLIIITRTDNVTEKEIQEVIAYTKQSLAAQLHEQNSSAKLDFVLKNLHFIPFSGKMALWHRTGKAKEAIEAGYTLEKSGILALESYLEETLFGKNNERSLLIIKAAKKRLSHEVSKIQEQYHYELILQSKSKVELEAEQESAEKRNRLLNQTYENFESSLADYKDQAQAFIRTLDTFIENELLKLQGLIKKRLLDETRFVLEKEKKAPTKRRIDMIVDTAIKHGLTDIMRDYRYKFIKISTQIQELLSHQYSELFMLEDSQSTISSNHDLFSQGLHTNNYVLLKSRLEKLLERAHLSKLFRIEDDMTSIIHEAFADIEHLLKVKAQTLSHHLLEDFFNALDLPLQNLKAKVQSDTLIVKKLLESLKEDESLQVQHRQKLLEKSKKLDLIAKRCSL